MPLWAYVLMFIAILLLFGWVVDWRSRRVRRGLPAFGDLRPEGGHVQDTIDRTQPGTTFQRPEQSPGGGYGP